MDDDYNYLLDVVHSILNSIDQFIESGDASVDFQPLMFKMDYLQRLMVNLDVEESIAEMVGQAYRKLQIVDSGNNVNSDDESPGTTALVRSGARGRPSFDIKEDQLQYLLEQGFKVSDVSKIVGTSKRTVERRMASFGLSVTGTYSDITDEQLDYYVVRAASEHPRIGIRMIKGYLQSNGLRIQRHRIRSSLMRTDPISLLERWRNAIKRRCYNVKYPLSLWHIDGNHKLIRWRIVIHGGVDGYSRIPVFLKASNNNRADTVLDVFVEAVSEYGLPSRVRSDKGGENVQVASYMLSHRRRCPGRGSMITGRSTHNQRIERLWRDLFIGCLSLFYDLFYHMENQGMLHPDSEHHLWYLHYVFLPIINRHIRNWKNAWVNHPLRTEKNKTPIQLWVTGLQSAGIFQGYDDIIQGDVNIYGVDWHGPIPESYTDVVQVAEVPCPFNAYRLTTLPLTMNMTYLEGIDAFNNLVTLV